MAEDIPSSSGEVQQHVVPTETVPSHVWEFANELDALRRAADQMRDYLYELSMEALIPVHSIESRAKSLTSYMDKCSRTNDEGFAKYQDPRSEIDDCVAARVIVYTTRARQDFVGLLKTRLRTRDHENPGEKKHNGYDSDHLVVTGLDYGHLSSRYPDLPTYFRHRPGLEVQIRTVAGHAWAEYEHDVRYKSSAYRNLNDGDQGRVDQWFIEAGGLRRYLDQIFNEIDEFLVPTALGTEEVEGADEEIEAASEADGDSGSLTADVLTELLEVLYPETEIGNRDGLEELIGHLENLGIKTVEAIQAMLDQVDRDEVASLMDYPSVVSATRRLDDELLAMFARRYVEAAPNAARQQLLELRLRRVNGKFAIYEIAEEGGDPTRPITAARAVRELTRIVSERVGPDHACIENAIALERSALPVSTHPRVVTVKETDIYVATNLARSYAEKLMTELLAQLPEGSVSVFRAGDQLLPVPDL